MIGPATRDPHASPARRDSLTQDDATSSMSVYETTMLGGDVVDVCHVEVVDV